MADFARKDISVRKGMLCMNCGATFRGGLRCKLCGKIALRIVKGEKPKDTKETK